MIPGRASSRRRARPHADGRPRAGRLLRGPATPPVAGRLRQRPACPTSQPPALAKGETRTVTIQTAKGAIAIKVEADLSPIAAGNFVALAGCGCYDGVVFHRIATLQDGTPFVIQGGPTGTAGPGYTIQDEPVTATYKRGTVAMARTAEPNSVGSQFFIVLDDKDAAGPRQLQHVPDHRLGDVRHGRRRRDLRGGRWPGAAGQPDRHDQGHRQQPMSHRKRSPRSEP